MCSIGVENHIKLSALPFHLNLKSCHIHKWSLKYEIIRIHHECESGIEKSVPRITEWHHELWRVMTNGDHEGRIFLSHPHTNNEFFFLLPTKYFILYWKSMKKSSRKSQIRWDAKWWHHFNITMTSRIDVRLTCSCSFFIFPTGSYGYVRIILHG